MQTVIKPKLKVADEVWVAAALLHKEHPERRDFEALEIKKRAEQERRRMAARYSRIESVYVHAIQHCVANIPRETGAYRMLFATGKTTRRLFRPGDPYHPSREHGRTIPEQADLPHEYHSLLDWYANEYAITSLTGENGDPILRLRGLGSGVWQDEEPDRYVQRLREGWA